MYGACKRIEIYAPLLVDLADENEGLIEVNRDIFCFFRSSILTLIFHLEYANKLSRTSKDYSGKISRIRSNASHHRRRKNCLIFINYFISLIFLLSFFFSKIQWSNTYSKIELIQSLSNTFHTEIEILRICWNKSRVSLRASTDTRTYTSCG